MKVTYYPLICTVIHATKFYMEQFLSSTINIIWKYLF